ncbi:NAD-dependent epimerase/dehydratase family protein [Oscillatoria sp. FACHB-1407]|uniref:NAD-dependent epimerase/dehydratase family protein n=2 Tax=Oscillatoria sp. FACHB-1407 TaxID=2692847 RepID=UPI0035CCCDB3
MVNWHDTMYPKRILLTGASGCIGHYIADGLIHNTPHELFLLVRNPQKLQFDYEARPGITILQGDLRQIERYSRLLKTMDSAILTATAWGGTQEVFDVNVVKTIRLMNLLDPDVCQQVIYFSTASILGRDNQPLRQAGELGTDYIRSKYMCHQQLSKLAIAPRITTLFPTLVFGGDSNKPYSHLSAGIPEIVKWRKLARFLRAEGSFHFMHGYDIAQVVLHLLEHPPGPDDSRELILGNPPLTVNQAVRELCAYFKTRVYFGIPLTKQLTELLINVFRIQVAAWDRFCLQYRHFTYQNPISPATYGLTPYCATLTELFQVSGVNLPQRTKGRK